MDQGDDPYTILGLTKDASSSEIKKSYRKLALKYHPDKNDPDDKEAGSMFAKVSGAYELLSDENKRQNYDLRQERGDSGFNKNKTYETKPTTTTTRTKPARSYSSSTEPSSDDFGTSSTHSTRTSTSRRASSSAPSSPVSPPKRSYSMPNSNYSYSPSKSPTKGAYTPRSSFSSSNHSTSFSPKSPKNESNKKATTGSESPKTKTKSSTTSSTYRYVATPKTTSSTKSTTSTKSSKTSKTSKKSGNAATPAGSKSALVANLATKMQPKQAVPEKKGLFGRSSKKGVKSTSSSSRSVKHPGGRIETITQTTTVYHDGRTETKMSSSFSSAPASPVKTGKQPVRRSWVKQ